MEPPRFSGKEKILGQSIPGCNGQWRGTLHSPNLLGWSLAISFFNVISRTLIEGESYTSAEIQSAYSTPQQTRLSHHQHHHVVSPARISLTPPRQISLWFIASGRSSGLHPVSSHNCCMYVRAGRPAFARPYVGVHRSTSLMSLCPACLVRLIWIIFVMGGRWPYSCLGNNSMAIIYEGINKNFHKKTIFS